jgi:hypothetical protein
MKTNQLSLFLENRPGRLSVPCKILSNAGINILTLSLADTQQFGVLRLIVKDWERARELLRGAGCVANVTEVVAIEVADEPGGLAKMLEVIDQCGINVEYMYPATFRSRKDSAILIFRFDDPDQAIAYLKSRASRIVGADELCEMTQR